MTNLIKNLQDKMENQVAILTAEIACVSNELSPANPNQSKLLRVHRRKTSKLEKTYKALDRIASILQK